MEENYIHIFCVFLGQKLLEGKISQKDVVFLLKEFYPICENVNNRGDLVSFLNKFTLNHSFLEELKFKLSDKNYIFSFKI